IVVAVLVAVLVVVLAAVLAVLRVLGVLVLVLLVTGILAVGRGGGGRRRFGLVVEAVVEADHDLGKALLARLVQPPVPEQQLHRPREAGQRQRHLVEAFLDALGDRDLAFAGQ